MLKTIRMFATKGLVMREEFEHSEDDMAYVFNTAASSAISVPRENDGKIINPSSPPKSPYRSSFGFSDTEHLNTDTVESPDLPTYRFPIPVSEHQHQYSLPMSHDRETADCDVVGLSVANDMFVFSENSSAKQRLSVSFAIAQSSVLAILEARIERKIEEYKYIPEVRISFTIDALCLLSL